VINTSKTFLQGVAETLEPEERKIKKNIKL
jgi:hypothetical protein